MTHEKRRLPFLVLGFDENVELVVSGQETKKLLQWKCVLAIVAPGSVSYYQFSDPLVRSQYAANLLAICTHGRENVQVREW